MANSNLKVKKANFGECHCCERDGMDLTPSKYDATMMQCSFCMADEEKIMSAIKVVETSRKIDATIELKADIYNAATVSFAELQAAIENNPAIPSDRKNYVLAEECAARIEQYNKVIFAEEQALLEKRNERHAWLQNTVETTSKLRADQREKFKQYNLNYKPATPKTVKPGKQSTTAKAPKVKFSATDLRNAAVKYGQNATAVQMTAVQRNITPEEAAKFLKELREKN